MEMARTIYLLKNPKLFNLFMDLIIKTIDYSASNLNIFNYQAATK